MSDELDQWFVQEILPHEELLMRFLGRIWPHRHEIPDLRQEVYIRVYEAAAKVLPRAPRSFLFTAARNLVADRRRRGRVVSIEATADIDALNVLIDESSPEMRTSAREDLSRLADAFDQLPPRCRAVIWMRKVEGLSQKEAAAQLGVSEGAIEKQIAKGVTMLAALLSATDAVDVGVKTSGREKGVTYGKQRSD
jgi:RNA polymerase sigma factor (sigma-70 family)